MNETRFCEHCGATLAPNALFCEACGRSVAVPAASADQLAAPLAAPAATAPRPANRGMIVGLGIVGVLVALGCLAVAVFGFWSLQSNPSMPSQLPVGTPQVGVVPTYLVPTNVSPSAASTIPPPTSAPLATGAPSLPAGVLFLDDFASQEVSKRNGWNLASDDVADRTWSPNQYTISIKKANSGPIELMPDREYADFALETEAQPLDENVNVYGLVFRFSQDQNGKLNYYRFALVPDGRYSLGKLVAGEWQTRVVDYTASPTIKTGKNKNILGVIAQGNTFSLYINRTLVKTVTDDTVKGSGTIGITAGNAANVPAAVSFSRLTVLTPDKAQADWGGTTAPAPPTASNLPRPTTVPPTLAAPPGLYVSALRLEPGSQRGVDIGFYPMFLNTTGGTQTYRVKVYVYRPDNMRNSYGETSTGQVTIPVGSTEQKAAGSWKLGGGGGCEDFVARVGWIDDQNRITYFNAPAGGTFESRFSVCP